MKLSTSIFVRTTFRAMHCWGDALPAVGFLKHLHRHVFHVEARLSVTHDDRDHEFFMVQSRLDGIITSLMQQRESRSDKHSRPQHYAWSCERWAALIFERLTLGYRGVLSVAVSEDGENGALVERSKPLKSPDLGARRSRERVPATRARRKRATPLKTGRNRPSG